jgi:hypothetical protein
MFVPETLIEFITGVKLALHKCKLRGYLTRRHAGKARREAPLRNCPIRCIPLRSRRNSTYPVISDAVFCIHLNAGIFNRNAHHTGGNQRDGHKQLKRCEYRDYWRTRLIQ